MKKPISNRIKLIILGLILVAFIAFYFLFKLNFKKPALLNYQLKRRATTMIAMIIAGFAIGGASIVFQSVINNSIVTPCILGMNSLYTVVRTLIVFVFGTGSIFFLNANLSFAINLIIMVILAYFIYGAMFKKTKYNVLYILLIGTVLSSLFGSIQSAIVRIMDSNEYDTLLTSLTASFDSINTEIIITGVILLALVTIILYKDIKMLNVITLGKEQAINLGVNYDRVIRRLLISVTIYIAIATAMVGPISFLGLITANLARLSFKTYKHSYLISGTASISIIGQVIVERVVSYSIPISVFITIGGGIYFLFLIIKSERRA